MQLPVDIKALLNEAINIDKARHTPLSVSIYIDDSAPGDVQAQVRLAFASASPHTRVSLIYLDGRPFFPYSGDDFAVIVAGLNEGVGAYAQKLREASVPVMVITTLPSLVSDLAKVGGYPIPEGDLIAPKAPRPKKMQPEAAPSDNVQTKAVQPKAMQTKAAQPKAVTLQKPALFNEILPAAPADCPPEPYHLDKEAIASLLKRMGDWVVDACNEKRLAFALAFPFVRRPLSLESVNATALQNAGVGFLFIIPGADMPIMTLNQAKMLLMIAAAYGEELNIGRVKEFAALVCGAFMCRGVARRLVSFIPALSWVTRAAVGYAGTMAMGYAAIEYYEGETPFAKVSEAVAAARDKAISRFGKRVVASIQTAGSQMLRRTGSATTTHLARKGAAASPVPSR